MPTEDRASEEQWPQREASFMEMLIKIKTNQFLGSFLEQITTFLLILCHWAFFWDAKPFSSFS